ncbi:uncharacterized protein LOC132741980 [Ruditapes philippinarum]|uniref:uncharacterized protein LOC132741980 n=1 Tax=Ruditapes philippinarum TaxID=129788 RepID=UPI00295AC191|nr:uncharacterized protein LOC132741980 [Ruditapes philippinarum]
MLNVLLVIFGIVCKGFDAFLLDEPCNRTMTTPEIDFIIGKDCQHGLISFQPSASGSLAAHVINSKPNTCNVTTCLRSCNTVSSSIFALTQDPFHCCHVFPRPTIAMRDFTDMKNETLYKTSSFGNDWICTRPHSQQRIVLDFNVRTLQCPVLVEYDILTTC